MCGQDLTAFGGHSSLLECRLWSTWPRPPDEGRLIYCLLCIAQSKSIWNHSQIGSDRWWSSQADWSACSQKSGCPMKLTPPALKHHRTPSDFVARFAGICSAPIKAVFSALRVIFIFELVSWDTKKQQIFIIFSSPYHPNDFILHFSFQILKPF